MLDKMTLQVQVGDQSQEGETKWLGTGESKERRGGWVRGREERERERRKREQEVIIEYAPYFKEVCISSICGVCYQCRTGAQHRIYLFGKFIGIHSVYRM